MSQVRRFDTVRLDKTSLTPQGFLRMPMFAARTGIQVYRKADGSILKEYRPPEEVFSNDTMQSFKSAPITDDHPQEFVTAENAKDLMVGFTGEQVEKADNMFIKADAIITDKAVIQKILDGKVEVSAGYSVDLDFTPGEIEGEKFDAIQRRIRTNHVAIVDRGRAGPDVRLRMDSDAVLVTEKDTTEEKMKKLELDGKTYEVAPEVFDAFSKHADEIKGLKGKVEGLEKADKSEELKAMTEKHDALQAKYDALKTEEPKEKKTDRVEISKLVKERVRIEGVAGKVLKKDELEKALTLEDIELKKAVIKAELPEFNFEGKSDAYIDARFDVIAESAKVSKEENDKLSDLFKKEGGNEGEKIVDSYASMKKAMERDANLWKQPVGRQGSMKAGQKEKE